MINEDQIKKHLQKKISNILKNINKSKLEEIYFDLYQLRIVEEITDEHLKWKNNKN